MRRLLGVVSLIGLGLLLGFLVRLIWPRPRRPVYAILAGDAAY